MENEILRHCPKCDTDKSLSEFHYNRKQLHYSTLCKKCITKRTQKWCKDNPERFKLKMRKRVLKNHFGISLEGYNDYFIRQEGKCAICGIHQKDLKSKLAVDHDHKTYKVRGLLCYKCNLALGFLHDDPNLTQKATQYLLINNN